MGRKDSSFSEVLRPLSRSGHCSVLSRGAFPLCHQQSYELWPPWEQNLAPAQPHAAAPS